MNCVKQIFTISVILIVCYPLAAQETPSISAYIELLGNGGWYSVNFEKEVQIKGNPINLRIGFGDYPLKVSEDIVHGIGIPIGLNQQYRLSKSFILHVGLGVSYIRGLDVGGFSNVKYDIQEPSQGIYLIPSLGFSMGEKKYFARIKYDPLFAIIDLTNRKEFDKISDPVIKLYSDSYLPIFENYPYQIGLVFGIRL